MSKTIPIWASVLNRAIVNHRKKVRSHEKTMQEETDASNCAQTRILFDNWDCSLHLPLWVPDTEKAAIEERLEQWTKELEDSGADISSIASSLKKPLQPLWISQKTVIWLNEVPDHDSWDFTPIILISASAQSGIYQKRTSSEFSWNYIPGAGDDEESWARGLSPTLFWHNAYDLISSEPGLCNQKVADIVEKDRVYRSQRGINAPQVTRKPQKMFDRETDPSCIGSLLPLDVENCNSFVNPPENDGKLYWLGSSGLAVGSSEIAAIVSNVDCILICDQQSINASLEDSEAYLHLPMLSSKFDRFSILSNLPAAVRFVEVNLKKGKRLLVCCQNGEDISVCVCLAILTSLFNDEGTFDDGKSFSTTQVTKLEMRRRLVFICKYAVNARPSRGNLKQVFAFLTGQRSVPSTSPWISDK